MYIAIEFLTEAYSLSRSQEFLNDEHSLLQVLFLLGFIFSGMLSVFAGSTFGGYFCMAGGTQGQGNARHAPVSHYVQISI